MKKYFDWPCFNQPFFSCKTHSKGAQGICIDLLGRTVNFTTMTSSVPQDKPLRKQKLPSSQEQQLTTPRRSVSRRSPRFLRSSSPARDYLSLKTLILHYRLRSFTFTSKITTSVPDQFAETYDGGTTFFQWYLHLSSTQKSTKTPIAWHFSWLGSQYPLTCLDTSARFPEVYGKG